MKLGTPSDKESESTNRFHFNLLSHLVHSTLFSLDPKCLLLISHHLSPRLHTPSPLQPSTFALLILPQYPTSISAPPPDSSVNEKITNHWVMYLAASSTRSICLDSSPAGPENSLGFIITSKDHAYPMNVVKAMHLTPEADLTVGHVFDYIINSKYDKYTFSAGGQGCRFWIYPVVALLRSAKVITDDSSEVDDSTKALRVAWSLEGFLFLPVSRRV